MADEAPIELVDPASGSAAEPAAGTRGEAARRRRLLGAVAMLAICSGTIAVGARVQVSVERAHWHSVEGPKCLIRGILGDGACPGCGLTRATALVLQGRTREAWEIHGGGFVVAFLCAAGIPFQADILRRGGRVTRAHILAGRAARIALLLGVVIPWLWHLVAG